MSPAFLLSCCPAKRHSIQGRVGDGLVSQHHETPDVITSKREQMTLGIFTILLGIVVIVLGITTKQFNPAFMRHTKPEEKPTPRWLGMLIWVAGGIWCIYMGFTYIRHPLK
ncbi:MAG: hypothetical protein JWO91_2186 [Acidobacteriaceae bacterium]|nr:hypothetical protein [Acidobacteriaceae bacterium]